MNPRVKDVKPTQNYTLHLWFKNGEEGIFDMKPYLDTGVFKTLKDKALFNTVRVCASSIAWKNNVDIAPETLYYESTNI